MDAVRADLLWLRLPSGGLYVRQDPDAPRGCGVFHQGFRLETHRLLERGRPVSHHGVPMVMPGQRVVRDQRRDVGRKGQKNERSEVGHG